MQVKDYNKDLLYLPQFLGAQAAVAAAEERALPLPLNQHKINYSQRIGNAQGQFIIEENNIIIKAFVY
jgi:hypothetical protein